MSSVGCFGVRLLAAGLAVFLVSQTARAGEVRARVERATYTVQSGDVLSVIAEKHGVPLAALRKVNGVASDTIRPGQVLLLPTAYEVKPGDALGIIAERFGVELSELLRHNELNEDSVLKVGQRVIIAGGSRVQHSSTTAAERKPAEPKVEYYEHEVRRNEVLSVIAARYEIPTKDLCRINRLGNASLIRVGQHLKIPITDQNEHLTRPKPWSKYARRNFERGKVTLQTLGGTVWTGRVFDEKGNILPAARKRIQSLLASWETGRRRQVALHPRLYELIVTVSDEFGGRPLRIVSGYRQRSYARHSKHRVGRALDFSIPGVPNSAVVDFLLTVPKTGVGYYPNTTHVHMDARSSRMYWVDVSGPGQPPRYVHKSTTGERAPEYASGPTAALHLGSSASSGAMARLGTKRQR